MITSHRPPRSYAEIAARVLFVIALIGLVLFFVRIGQVGIDHEGNVHFLRWGYCLLENMGCAP